MLHVDGGNVVDEDGGDVDGEDCECADDGKDEEDDVELTFKVL